MASLERHEALARVLRHPAIWRATPVAHDTARGIATGHASLDSLLPDGGWPSNALTELLVQSHGIGEVSVLLPMLRTLSTQGRGIALLAPPWLPQARAWTAAGIALERLLVIEASGTDLLWSAEQVLRSGECGAALLWSKPAGRSLDHRALQRLHLAAGSGQALCLVYRPPAVSTLPSPAPLRLQLACRHDTLQVRVLKCRGPVPAKSIALSLFPAHWRSEDMGSPSRGEGLSLVCGAGAGLPDGRDGKGSGEGRSESEREDERNQKKHAAPLDTGRDCLATVPPPNAGDTCPL